MQLLAGASVDIVARVVVFPRCGRTKRVLSKNTLYIASEASLRQLHCGTTVNHFATVILSMRTCTNAGT